MGDQSVRFAALHRLRLDWRPSEPSLLLTLAIGVGIATGLGVWLFDEGITFFRNTFQDGLLRGIASVAGPWVVLGIVPVLALAGLIVGWLLERFVGEERHHGVAGIMASTALTGGRLPYRQLPIKALLASFSLGAGASVGPEDPSAQIGANLGSMLGQWLRLSDEHLRLLVGAGAAGGIAAVFHAPIAGVFFALEVILSDFSSGTFGVVVLTAVIASVTVQAVSTSGPELGISSYSLGGLQEIPFYVLLGVLLAPVSALFIRALYWQQDVWHHLKLSRPIKTMCAGALVGVLAILLPQIMGTGRETLNAMLDARHVEFTISLLLVLALAKMLATTVSLGGGFVGGMFAPSLFVGAALGRAFGQILIVAFPGALTADPAAFAIAGMAAVMAGVIRAPITAAILLFELTDDYQLILPILLTTAICVLLVERLAPDGIYHLGLARHGIRLRQGQDISLLQTVTVGEVMQTKPHTVPSSLPVNSLAAEFNKESTHGLPVIDDNGLLYGIVTLEDWTRARESGKEIQQTVAEICTRDLFTVTPETRVSEALKIIGIHQLGRLPVVEANHFHKLVGLLRRRDIVQAYTLAIQRRQDADQQAALVRLETFTHMLIIELRVEPGSAADNGTIRKIDWPSTSLLATVRRKAQVIVPHGDTPLQAGDVLVMVTTLEDLTALTRITKARPQSQLRTADKTPGK